MLKASPSGIIKTEKQYKGLIQLHLFEPRDFNYDYKVIVTNKRESAKTIVLLHNGRGSLETIPSKRLAGNQIFTLRAMMAHSLARELQMLAAPSASTAPVKRPAAWAFAKPDTFRHRIIQRAGRFTRPQNALTLTMSANDAVRKDLLHFLDVLQKVA